MPEKAVKNVDASKHRRTGTKTSLLTMASNLTGTAAASAADGNAPTSTTKGLLVTVIAPRRIATSPAKQQPETEPEPATDVPDIIMVDSSQDEELNAAEPPPTGTGDEQLEQAVSDQQTTAPNSEISSQSAHSNTQEMVEKSAQAEAEPTTEGEAVAVADEGVENDEKEADKKGEEEKEVGPVKIKTEEKTKNGQDQPAKKEKVSLPNSAVSSLAGNSKVEEEQQVTEEEKAAVKVGNAPEEAEIHLEELLRIAFRSLLEDYHLLNVPTYSLVLDKQIAPAQTGQEESNWIRIDVMAKPASLGIILERLERIGIGDSVGTVTVFKAELCKTASPYAQLTADKDKEEKGKETDKNSDDGSSEESRKAGEEEKSQTEEEKLAEEKRIEEARLLEERRIAEARMEWKNAATRLRIEQVREQIMEQTALTFDFLSLLTVASILAAVGLITNNTVVIVASMLVSPIMGPVLGLTFGFSIRDWPLVKKSIRNEVLALLGCIVIGALAGLGSAFTNVAEEWPTNEMEIRGEYTGLLTGIAVAIPSGMGVCLSILGGNTSSLVGVAISASLLPPAVNTGICLVYSIFLSLELVENDFKNAGEFAVIGGISFALTALNIVCIWISGIVMFEIKEVAPTESKGAFWQTDLKVARELNTSETAKPAPVNIKIIRDGIESALNQKEDGKVGSVRIQTPKDKNSFFDKTTLNAAFALSARRRKLGGKAWAQDLVSDEMYDKPQKEEEKVRYVGLDYMANLLGFADGDDDVDHAAVASKLGHGRYL